MKTFVKGFYLLLDNKLIKQLITRKTIKPGNCKKKSLVKRGKFSYSSITKL